MNKTPLRDMDVAELKARLTRIEDLNPHNYASLQSWRNTLAALRRKQEGQA